MCHFQSSSFETTLDIESFICFAAVQDGLVASDLLSGVVQCLYDSQTKLFALLVLRDSDVLDVTDESQFMDTISQVVSIDMVRTES
jgi:spore coat protein CotH